MAKNTLPQIETAHSPYGLAGFLSEVLGEEIAPQRMYQYVRSGKLVVEINELGKKVVTPENGNAFIAWFLDPERGKRASTEGAEVADEAVAAS